MFFIGLIVGFFTGMIFISVVACIYVAGEKDKERESNDKT